MFTELLYALYLSISVAMTIWVARTLHRAGGPFLVEAFHGNGALAESVNRLLVVGFYLVNIGFILLWLKVEVKPHTTGELIEVLSTHLGVVLLVVGFMHFMNVAIFSRMRTNARSRPEYLNA